ncbi:TetR-like C-terminal domain-containing protein [Gordonia liuliyuniae]|uniref:WHG domain-containing protein n=1 Tax=Gordonia liuliyuniae TaxID=2911517 RepID=A0ABS9ITK0_9ACTN|nr:TetR-like C-terminal domain-containing protein [Gordonia liuliyuniae]MCF8588822.1 WHG domain-containing protein [Gordonia liuliyuniae]
MGSRAEQRESNRTTSYWKSPRSIRPLATGVRRAVEAGVFRAEDPETIVASLWSQVHGMALLMLGGHWPSAADPARAATAAVDGWRA